jgi:hypothetical protein
MGTLDEKKGWKVEIMQVIKAQTQGVTLSVHRRQESI